jgi:cellulose synthase operon protein C
MIGSLASQRDRQILRSFSRRIDPSDAGAYNNLGVLYYHKGMHEEAVAAFTRALELDSRMQVAQRNLEIAYFSTGYYDRRVAELRERLAARPEDRDARWELGRAYASLGQVPEAMTEFEALLEQYPDDGAALVQMGLALKTNGDLEQAQQWFERALALEPDSPVVNFYLGEVFYNRGLSENALILLARAIELSPDSPDAHYLLGFVLGDLGRHEEAREATRRAVQLNPSLSRAQPNLSLERYGPAAYQEMVAERERRRSLHPMEVAEDKHLAHCNLGLAFRRKGYYAEALREYRIALERGEDRHLVLQAMAEVHLLRHDPEAALELYDRLVTEQPGSPKIWSERGVALHQAGRAGEAAASYRRALEVERSYALAHNNLGVALYHEGDPKGALVSFRAALSVQPRFIKAWLNLALLLFRGRRFPLALEAYRQVLTMKPEQPVAWNGIGLVLAELRKFEDARNAFARAIQSRENFAEAHYNLSFTLSNLGDYDGALRATRRALELDSYYVAQRFELAMDVEHEEPDLTLPPEFDGAQRVDTGVEAFSFDPDLLDSLFGDLRLSAVEPAAAVVDASPYALARDYLGKGLLDRAAAEASRAISRGASRTEGLIIQGDVYTRRGLYGEALERFREARSSNGVSPAALSGETRALVMLGRAGEAREPAESLLAYDSTDVETLLLAATVYAGSGDPGRARELLTQARRLAPARADVLKQIGDVARAVGDAEGAITAYRHALDLDQDFAVVHFELARLLAADGGVAEAERALLAALESVPTYAAAALELAQLRRRNSRPRQALPPLVELLQRDSSNVEALQILAETLLDLDRQSDAVIAAGRVLCFDPDHPGALYVHGRVLADRKRYPDAIELWQRVVERAPDSEYARRARRDARTAADLMRIFRHAEVA